MAASEWTSGLIMVAVDVVFAVMNTLIKEATERGLDRAVLITLRQLVAALFMAPVAFFHDRKTRPKLTLEICVYLFFSALLGASLTQYLFYLGMEYTSAAFACAFLNLTPAFTFLISLPLRLESLDWKTKPGLAKALGVVLCFLGVTVLTFYQGPVLQLSHALLRTCWKNLNGNMTCGFQSHKESDTFRLIRNKGDENPGPAYETRKVASLPARHVASLPARHVTSLQASHNTWQACKQATACMQHHGGAESVLRRQRSAGLGIHSEFVLQLSTSCQQLSTGTWRRSTTNGVHDSSTRTPRGRPERESYSPSGKWLRGSAALLGGSFCWSSWFPLQAKVGKKYPAIYTSTAVIFFLGFLQAATVSLVTSRGRISAWLLEDKLEIGTVFFAGALGSGVGFLAMSWCVEQRGPVFTAAFTPLVQIIVAAIHFLFLHQQIFLGSVLGSILVILGLYSLLWAKRNEAHLLQPKPQRPIEAHEQSQQAQPQV
ncbi:WAT1-related protein At4g01440-like [Zingiber officinale]|uniref:WAT1-related protein At4g01440-like n=1 Tax=Zingiber officinale TaxID=94328 RepID=UPI001C4BAF5A|nr:WAT1-related protein At4g01440-like [Zingiber officinale]